MSQAILSGELQLEGKYVRLVTSDGETHKFRITEIDSAQGVIRGKDQAISVRDVVTIEKKEADHTATGLTLVIVTISIILLGGPAFL